ncbi:hypothetical protein GCM10023263_93990 [Phytohabitans rumicis]
MDDRPDANLFERARVSETGYAVIQAESTAKARQMLGLEGPVAVIVSDMGRIENGAYNPKAGLDLVRQLRDDGDQTRVVFYSSQRSLTTVDGHLANIPNVAYTTSPTELSNLLDLR